MNLSVRQGRSYVPGLAAAAVVALLAAALAGLVEPLSPLPVAVVLGIIVGNTVSLPAVLAPGMKIAAKHVLRIGIVLLGLRLVLGDVADLGAPALLLVAGVAVVTFAGVLVLARALGLAHDLGMLTAAGFAICGASAVAAVQGVVGAEEEDVAAALGNVMVFGTLSILAFPLIGVALGISDPLAGAWIGASVHDVGQAVATAGAVSETALEAAVVVKLARVLLLAPLVIVVGLLVRRRGGASDTARPPLVPWFVAGFLLTTLLRSTGAVPEAAVDVAAVLEQTAFAAALFALGTMVRLQQLRHLGPRPLVLGAVAWVLIASVALLGVHQVL